MSLRESGMGDGTMSTRSVSKARKTSEQQSAEIARLEGRVRVLQGQCAQLRVENRTLIAEKAAAERRIRELEAEVARLTADLEASRRAGKRQAAPFSKGPPKTNPRRPGRKPGKAYGPKARRQPPPPDQIDEFYSAPLPRHCPYCQGAVKQDEVRQQFQVELPQRPIYRRFDIGIGHCQRCGRRVQGRHPLQTSDALGAAAAQLGPVAQASIVWLNKRLGLSHGKIVDLLDQLFGIPLSRGGSAQVVLRSSRRCEDTYAQIQASVRRSPWLVNDETGWKIGGHSGWLHVVVGEEATCFTIAKQRNASVQAQLVGANYSGTIIHDGYSSYNRRFHKAIHQQCLSHLIRRLEKMLPTARGRARGFPEEVLALTKYALALRDDFRSGKISEDDLAEWYLGFFFRLDTLVKRPRSNTANRKLAKHIRKHIREWFWFLLDPSIDATNYRAEQALRFGVTNRKVWGGNRTVKGKNAQAILMSVMETVRRQGQNPLDFVAEILRNKSPPARHVA
jgi:transposase